MVGCGNLMRGSDVPGDLPESKHLYPDPEEWINPGDSLVAAPGGALVAGPLRQESGILYGEIDLAQAAMAKRALDVAGHYARPDIFTLEVNSRSQSPVQFSE